MLLLMLYSSEKKIRGCVYKNGQNYNDLFFHCLRKEDCKQSILL